MKRAAGLGALLSTLWSAACTNQEAGEVTLVVSTDLSLPADLNWLEWSVAPLAHPEQAQTGGIALDRYDALPATLAVVAGKQSAETVLVRVSGRTGGEGGPVRVTREAQFTLPEHSQQMLRLPLSWLCSDVNLPEPCGKGMTCDAGSCVSSANVVLVDHLPSQSATCFDVLQCTLVQKWLKQTPDLDADGHCVLEPKAVLGSPENVAIEVNTANVGNAGVCAPGSDSAVPPPNAGSCFIPLAENDGPGGWDLIKNTLGQTVIRLPHALCEPTMRHSIASVAVTLATCPSKHGIEPTCGHPSVCVPSPASCPEGISSTWSGYSCSGAASPVDDPASGFYYCGVSDADPQLKRSVRGHYCCTAGQAASKDPRVIDDMTGGPLIKFRVPPEKVAGSWFTASDDDQLPLSPPQAPHTLFTYRDIDPAVTPDGGPTITRAACFRMDQGLSGYYALEGFSFYGSGAEATELDVSQISRGISFWAMLRSADPDIPQPIRVVFPNRDTDTQHPMSTCLLASSAGKSNCDSFGAPLLGLTERWQKKEVLWTELKQTPGKGHQFFPAFDTHVYSVDFQATGPGPDGRALPFDFCVSQISFLE